MTSKPSLNNSAQELQSQLLDALYAAQFEPDQYQALLASIDGVEPQFSNQRMAVYRNNVFHSLTTALADTFPVVKRLIGEPCFNALAKEFIAKQQPKHAELLSYGYEFIELLSTHQATKHLGYLPDVALLEWQYLAAYHSVEQQSLDPQQLQAIAPEQLPELKFSCKACCQWLASDWPILPIWHANQSDEVDELDLSTLEPSRLLIYRPELEVQIIDLEANCFNFATALAKGNNIEQAWQLTEAQNHQQQLAALDQEELSNMLSYLLSLGIFSSCELSA